MPKLSKINLIMCIAFFLQGCDMLADLPVGKGFTAKYLCSSLFNSGLDEDLVIHQFIRPKVQPLPLVWQIDVDYENKQVTVADRVFLNESLDAIAVHREHMGCTLLIDKTPEEIAAEQIQPLQPPQLDEHLPWPQGHGDLSTTIMPGLNTALLNEAVEEAFLEVEEVPRNTTSLLVAHDGHLIAEKYALGVGKDSPVLGWSMTKSVTATLIGILVDQGRLDIDTPAPIPSWQGTEKENITLRDILHMASGLDFNEDYEGFSTVSEMLYKKSDQSAYAASLPLNHEPGTFFNYSTGDTSLLARVIQNEVGGTTQDAYNFFQRSLFHKIGITSALIEVDESGLFVGGAYGYMSPRDWLRVGQLYLQEGSWNGEQVVSKDWVQYVSEPSPASYYYGAQFWLNNRHAEWKDVPEEAYFFAGHQGQVMVVVPSYNLVVLRTGVTEDYYATGLNSVISKIIEALPQ